MRLQLRDARAHYEQPDGVVVVVVVVAAVLLVVVVVVDFKVVVVPPGVVVVVVVVPIIDRSIMHLAKVLASLAVGWLTVA